MPENFRPSAFTPFLRRFTDERARDLAETAELYDRVRARHRASAYADAESHVKTGGEIYSRIRDMTPEALADPVCNAIYEIHTLEKTIFEFPSVDLNSAVLSLKEQTDLRLFLRAKEHFLANEARVIGLFQDALASVFRAICAPLPEILAPSPFSIPLICALPDPKGLLDAIIGEFAQERYKDAGLFVELFRRLYLNMCEVSGIADPYEPKKPVKRPSQNDAPLEEIVRVYLKGTPFRDLFLAPIPLKLTFEDRFSHMHVLGGSGAGKTTLLQNLILNDMQSDDPPSLVIVDSQGDLIDKLSHLAIFDPDGGSLADRFTLITPKDVKHPPALNIFAVNRERLGRYDEATKEQVTAGVIQTFDYLFAGLLGADLTAKQGVFFRFVARLMLALPETMGRNATILDMIALMDDPVPYRKAIESLPPIQRNFFERDFPSKTFAQTKEQIRYRLNAILENPTLARLFTAPETKIDIFDLLNQGGIILVDTAKDFLKGSSAHFGRIFISLVLQAILERAVIAERDRKPTFLIVDEAAAYFDSNIDDFLTEARKYRCGCVFAHQFLDQATPSLRASLAANTSIKMASGVSMGDPRALAPDMRTTADFVVSQAKLHFACHIRNVTPNAVSIPVLVGELERQPRLSADAYEYLRNLNRKRVSLPEPIQPTRGEGFTVKPDQGSDSSSEPTPRHHEFRPKDSKEDPSAASDEW